MDTQQTPRLNLLGDTSSSGGGCCGGGSCACGGGTAGAEATEAEQTGTYREPAPLADTITGAPDPATFRMSNAGSATPRTSGIGNGTAAPTSTQEFLVTGMTCGHCVASVKEEVGALDGISDVEVVLKKGGASRLTVTSAAPVDESAVRAAVEEAGYQLA